MTKPLPTLRRYTDLPALLHMLHTGKITLIDPRNWDDSNDSYFLQLYKQKTRQTTVLALCFSEAPETYHHWRVFAPGPAGVCIVFFRDALRRALEAQSGVMVRKVDYLTLTKVRAIRLSKSELPFIKRAAFADEQEVRAIYRSRTRFHLTLDVQVPLACIRSISLSPWLHENLFAATKAAIVANQGCEDLTVVRSSVVSNEEWKLIGDNA
jgi:hypothetical protein